MWRGLEVFDQPCSIETRRPDRKHGHFEILGRRSHESRPQRSFERLEISALEVGQRLAGNERTEGCAKQGATRTENVRQLHAVIEQRDDVAIVLGLDALEQGFDLVPARSSGDATRSTPSVVASGSPTRPNVRPPQNESFTGASARWMITVRVSWLSWSVSAARRNGSLVSRARWSSGS